MINIIITFHLALGKFPLAFLNIAPSSPSLEAIITII